MCEPVNRTVTFELIEAVVGYLQQTFLHPKLHDAVEAAVDVACKLQDLTEQASRHGISYHSDWKPMTSTLPPWDTKSNITVTTEYGGTLYAVALRTSTWYKKVSGTVTVYQTNL